MRAAHLLVLGPPLLGLTLSACEAGSVPVKSARDLQTTEAAVSLQQVTRGQGDEVNPSISPDGKLLAFETRAEGLSSVVVAPASTPARPRFRVPEAADPSWMPDGSGIVFVSEAQAGRRQVVKRELAAPDPGAILIPLGDPKLDARWPSVSADGRTLASSVLDIGVFDTKDVRARWFNAKLDVGPTNGYGVNKNIGEGAESAWSPAPHDMTVAFVRAIDGHGHIFIAGPDGKATQVTEGPDEDADPTWSPDGRFLAFCSAHSAEGGEMSSNANIFVVARDGSSFTQITEGDGFACKPSWSNDGWIYFHATPADKPVYHVWRVRWRNEGASRDLIPVTAHPSDAVGSPPEEAQ